MSKICNVKVSENYIAVPPGEEIGEQIEYRNMTKQEFAKKMGFSESFISDLIAGDVPLTTEIAVKLEAVLGIDAYFWNGLERSYREDLAKVNKENKRAEEAKKRWRYGNSSARLNTLSAGRV